MNSEHQDRKTEPASKATVLDLIIGKFASAEGKGGGEFYTPQCAVQVLVTCWNPTKAACSIGATVRAACSCNPK
jgi:type I restriction-modification system DNA methylase subunit